MKQTNKVDAKIKELLSIPMKLYFIPQLKAHLKYMHRWTLDELRDTVEIDDDVRDALEEIIKETGFYQPPQ